MSSSNNQGKRRSSETNDDVEPKTEMFKSLKARVFSLTQKNPLSVDNQKDNLAPTDYPLNFPLKQLDTFHKL
ncbi:unnamed protein product [Brachionus calyciflorus]|uniref:Uncharacterized protein n=1 Tax=Brachionus calyciflorus TaxID=104777 RepID=A0A814HK55_9BILA|nr:unnamed protein product [Brachionus calyciflorus]